MSTNMRVVLDTNIIVSALEFRGSPRLVFLRACTPSYTLVTSEILIDELVRVLTRKFKYEVSMQEKVESDL